MGEKCCGRRSRGRPGKLVIPGGGVAAEIATLALVTKLDPVSLMRTPPDVIRALYDGMRKLNERRRSKHG